MHQDLKILSQWLKANKLSFNVKKTELITFHPKNTKLKYSVKFKLYLDHTYNMAPKFGDKEIV